MRLGRKGQWWMALVATLLAAFAWRTVGLDRQPLWWDEGNSVYLAHQNLFALASESRATNDTDPPVYRLLLGRWVRVTGSSPFAVRFFSVLLGMIAVALAWPIGCWLTERKTALLSVLFVTITPMQVYYAREAKGYVFAAVCALLSVYAWGRKLGYSRLRAPLRRGAVRWWSIYLLSTAAALGTHYYLGLLILWQGLWVAGGVGLALIRRDAIRHDVLRRAGCWVLAAAGIALLLTPWVLTIFGTTVHGVKGLSQREPLSLAEYLGQVSGAFGPTPNGWGPLATIVQGGLAALLVIGTLTGRKRVFMLTWFVMPVIAAFVLQRAYSFFSPRFLLYLGVPWCLLIARGMMALGRRLVTVVPVVLVFAVVGLWIVVLAQPEQLPRIYPTPAEQAEDPRPVITHLCAAARPGDALAYGYIWQVGYLFSYCPQSTLSLYRAYFTPQSVGADLTGIFAVHSRLWLLDYRIAAEDPYNLPGSWLEAEAYRQEGSWYGHHHLALYLAPGFHTPGVGPGEGMASFGGLVGLRYPLVNAQLSPGDVLALPLYWQALTALAENYQALVQLSLPDTPPLIQSDVPLKWAVDQEVTDRRVLVLPEVLALGHYQIAVALYRLSDRVRLPLDGGNGEDFLVIGYVLVE